MSGLTERLREDWEMLKDGHQDNLTKTWHDLAVKNAAMDCSEAADALEAQEARIAKLESAIVEFRSAAMEGVAHVSGLGEALVPDKEKELTQRIRRAHELLDESLTPSPPPSRET